MIMSLSQCLSNIKMRFAVLDRISYSDSSVPFGNVLSADRVREIFADSNVLFGYGKKDLSAIRARHFFGLSFSFLGLLKMSCLPRTYACWCAGTFLPLVPELIFY